MLELSKEGFQYRVGWPVLGVLDRRNPCLDEEIEPQVSQRPAMQPS